MYLDNLLATVLNKGQKEWLEGESGYIKKLKSMLWWIYLDRGGILVNGPFLLFQLSLKPKLAPKKSCIAFTTEGRQLADDKR